jgi:hypothetical protein
MTYKSGICWCCEEKRPVDSHHIHPLEFGGNSDGKQVLLCKSCHSIAHYESEYYFVTGRYLEIDETFPETEERGKQIRKLISRIVFHKTNWLASGQDQNDQRRMTQISWNSLEELQLAHDVKRALNHRSLERAVKTCVFEMYKALKNKGRI